MSVRNITRLDLSGSSLCCLFVGHFWCFLGKINKIWKGGQLGSLVNHQSASGHIYYIYLFISLLFLLLALHPLESQKAWCRTDVLKPLGWVKTVTNQIRSPLIRVGCSEHAAGRSTFSLKTRSLTIIIILCVCLMFPYSELKPASLLPRYAPSHHALGTLFSQSNKETIICKRNV